MFDSFTKQLVLVGGGHSNVQVLKKLSMIKIKGLHTILISDNFEAVYSGMTPGYIHEEFNKDEICIDLQRLCFNANATFIKDKVVKLETNFQKLELQNYPPVYFDYLSINTGSVSNTRDLKIENQSNCFHVKPISLFIKKFDEIDKIINLNEKRKIIIIGGGVASYELAFSLKRRYENNLELIIIGNRILSEKNLNSKTRKRLKTISADLGIKEILGKVISISENKVTLKDGRVIESNLNLLSTGAKIEEWLIESDLERDKKGFIKVDENLLSINHKNIFVTGDACNIININRPKSGVMAVRQGEILKENIFLILMKKKLRKFKPQKNWLYLIGTYENYALLNYFFLSFHAKWCWRLKLFIDKNFIEKFKLKNNPSMSDKYLKIDHEEENKMYCQGCGSKVSKENLLNYLKNNTNNHNLSDSSVIHHNSLKTLQTIDHIKLFSSFNPFDFGKISYLHSQNDILASGGNVNSLSVSVGVPFSKNFIENFYLDFFMQGIKSEADNDKCKISSGHSYQSNEPGITINMNGEIDIVSSKSLAKEGDLIYLSKPLGTGYLLAAYFSNSNLISSEDFAKLIKYLKRGNRSSVSLARSCSSQTMTDISGYGLASHLIDICLSSELSSELVLNSNLLINSDLNLLNNYKSTGFFNNLKSTERYVDIANDHPLKNILYDPQTNGPMLMVIKQLNRDRFEKLFLDQLYIKPIYIGKFIKKNNKLLYIN